MHINKDNVLSFQSLNSLKIPLRTFYDANATLPTLLIETGVTTGRSFEAYKRGGKKEATERFTEQGASAVIWLWGVQFLNKIGNKIGNKFLNIQNTNFDIGKDILRDPVKNNKISKKELSFKAGNILTSTIIATYFIGFILPKITQKISSKYSKKEKTSDKKYISLEEYKNLHAKKDNKLNFKSCKNYIISLADTLQNNETARLLITDTGVVMGRYKNARNKYERIENLFRDISSIYFYLLFSKHVVAVLNKITKNTNINPDVLTYTFDELTKNMQNKKLSADEFKNFAIGTKIDNNIIKNLFNEKEIISVEKFIEQFPQYASKAVKMSELQPIFNDNRVLTKMQAKDVLSDGWISNPVFLKQAINKATKGKSDDKYGFISKKHLEQTRKSIDNFIINISNYAKKHNIEISKEFLEKVSNKNIIKSFAFNSIGVILSAFMLGIVIPKVQYFMSKKISKKEGFPGDFKEEK